MAPPPFDHGTTVVRVLRLVRLAIQLAVDASDQELGSNCGSRMDRKGRYSVGTFGHPLLDPAKNGQDGGWILETVIGCSAVDGSAGDAEGAGQAVQRLDDSLVRLVVAGVNDADALVPVHSVHGSQDVDGRPAFIPRNWRPGFDRHLGVVRMESMMAEYFYRLPYERSP